MPLQLSQTELRTVLDILDRHVPEREVRVFGSRAQGRAKPYSDLDLVVMGEQGLALSKQAELAQAFSDSELPWRVDLVLWDTTSPEFRKLIEATSQPLVMPDKP